MTAIRPTRTTEAGRALIFLLIASLSVGCSNANPPKVSDPSDRTDKPVPAGSTRLRGAGATFPSLLYKRWFSVFHDNHPSTYVSYDTVGSS